MRGRILLLGGGPFSTTLIQCGSTQCDYTLHLSCLDSAADSADCVSGNECRPYENIRRTSCKEYRAQRKAQGERRISAFVDTETLSFVDAYAQSHGLTKEETVRLALRQLTAQHGESPAA